MLVAEHRPDYKDEPVLPEIRAGVIFYRLYRTGVFHCGVPGTEDRNYSRNLLSVLT